MSFLSSPRVCVGIVNLIATILERSLPLVSSGHNKSIFVFNIIFTRFGPASNFVLLIVQRRYFCGGSFCFMSWCLRFFVLLAPYACFHIFS